MPGALKTRPAGTHPATPLVADDWPGWGINDSVRVTLSARTCSLTPPPAAGYRRPALRPVLEARHVTDEQHAPWRPGGDIVACVLMWRVIMSRRMSCLRAHVLVLAALAATFAAPCAAQFAAPMGTPMQGERDSYGAASYTVPAGWIRISNPNNPRAATYQSPVYNGGEVCRIAVFPAMPSSGNIINDARTTFAGMMGVDPLANSGPPFPYTTIIRGLSPEGWSYFIIKHSINGRFGEYGQPLRNDHTRCPTGQPDRDHRGHRQGPTGQPVLRRAGARCMARFFCQPALQYEALPAAGAGFPLQYRGDLDGCCEQHGRRPVHFHGAGPVPEHRSLHAAQPRPAPTGCSRPRARTLAMVASPFRATLLVLTPDNGRGNPTSAVIRIEQESKDLGVQLGAKWTDRLCLMEGSGEVCYNRSR